MGESSDSLFPSKQEFKKNLHRNFGIPTNQREMRATRRYLKKYGWCIAGWWLLILLAYPFLWNGKGPAAYGKDPQCTGWPAGWMLPFLSGPSGR